MATHDRAVALSRQLAQAHQQLRRRLAGVRADPGLTTHCLAFCAALTAHHEGEDTGLFAELLRERPGLAGTIAKLVEDHEMIASILTRVRDTADRSELDGLAAIMENHFRYEERALDEALKQGVPDTGWSEQVFVLRSR